MEGSGSGKVRGRCVAAVHLAQGWRWWWWSLQAAGVAMERHGGYRVRGACVVQCVRSLCGGEGRFGGGAGAKGGSGSWNWGGLPSLCHLL